MVCWSVTTAMTPASFLPSSSLRRWLLPRRGPRDPARLTRARDSRAGLCRRFDRLKYLHIAGAATEVAFECVSDLRARRVWVLVEERPRRHDEPGRAIPALD